VHPRRPAIAVAFAVLVTSTFGCGHDRARQQTPGKPEPTLGRGPWTTDEVTVFLRPAYDAMRRDLGAVASFDCSQGGPPGYAPSTTPEDQIFQCTVVFMGGRAGGRVVTFDERGAVAREIDLPPEYSVNPGIACTTEPELDKERPDCADVPVKIDTRPLPPADRSIYGSSPMPGERAAPAIGEPGSPADCGVVGGESIQAVRHPCSEARRLAAVVRADSGCRPPVSGDEHRCDVEGYLCEMNANSDETKPWDVSCSMDPQGSDNEDADYVTFDVPASF